MAAAYSMDLRTRVLKDSDAGLPSKILAERYHVSRAWVDALKQRRRETGSVRAAEADQISRPRVGRPGGSPGSLGRGAARCRRSPSSGTALRTSAGLATIWRALKQLDLTVKKNGTRRRATAP